MPLPATVLRRPLVPAGLALLAAAVSITGIVVAGVGRGYPAQQVRLLSGMAWLPSSGVGQVTLLDGSSAEVAAQLQVAQRGSTLDVLQQGSTAYAIDQSAGTIRRIDGATFEITQPESPIPDARGGLTAFADENGLYALDTERGILATTDPHTLVSRGQPLSLAAQLEANSAALDEAGRLWVLDNANGDLVSIAGERRATYRGTAKPGRAELTMAGGNPVVIDHNDRKAIVIDPASGETRNTVELDLRAGDEVAVSGSPHSTRLYLVASRGALAICDLHADECDNAVPLNTVDGELGAAVEAGNRLFIPDYTTGQVWIINLSARTVIAKPEVLTPPTTFQLLTRDGIVFYNDPASERAGVIDLDGGVHPIAKYDPKDPDKGLRKPATSAAEPTQPQQQTTSTAQTPAPPTQAPPTQPTQPTRPSRPTNPSTPRIAPPPTTTPVPGLRITLSDTTPEINQNVTLRVDAESGPPPTAAQWDFGDGTTGAGVTTGHAWTEARTFQISVQATMAGGRPATVSLSIGVSPPATVTVPDVRGRTQTDATAQLSSAGLAASVQQVVSNTVAAGVVIDQTPAGGATAAPGSTVNLTVSSGPRAPVSLITLASGASWRSGAGALPFNGNDGDDRGFALIRSGPYSFGTSGPCRLEDGSAPTYLETHPQWVAGGWIDGTYTLPSPVIAGDHFRATVGFIKCQNLGQAGAVQFVVSVIMPNGTELQVATQSDTGADGVMRAIDADLTPHVGATRIRLRVEAGSDSTQDWSSWVAPRIEG